MEPTEIAAKISQRRRQVLVHSIIYYRFDENIVTDWQWMQWAHELAMLQQMYPQIAAACPLAKEFEGFEGDTGYDLPMGDPHYGAVARWLLEYHQRRNR